MSQDKEQQEVTREEWLKPWKGCLCEVTRSKPPVKTELEMIEERIKRHRAWKKKRKTNTIPEELFNRCLSKLKQHVIPMPKQVIVPLSFVLGTPGDKEKSKQDNKQQDKEVGGTPTPTP